MWDPSHSDLATAVVHELPAHPELRKIFADLLEGAFCAGSSPMLTVEQLNPLERWAREHLARF